AHISPPDSHSNFPCASESNGNWSRTASSASENIGSPCDSTVVLSAAERRDHLPRPRMQAGAGGTHCSAPHFKSCSVDLHPVSDKTRQIAERIFGRPTILFPHATTRARRTAHRQPAAQQPHLLVERSLSTLWDKTPSRRR